MTLMRSTSQLATSVDQLTGETNIAKVQLDAKVALADAAVVATQTEHTAAEAARDDAAAHAADAATHLSTVKAGVTYQGISAIFAEKAVTAVDVFVYDTTLDSDGGAWRKRCQHTSWYNEPLNTATRGARREFPAVAVIVAETGKVTIYDGDDPALPMWMVFRVLTSYSTGIVTVGDSGAVTAVEALNGDLVVSTKGTGNNQGTNGVFKITFPADMAIKYCQSQLSTFFDLDIANRNSGGNNYLAGVSLPRLVGNQHSDVTITVLPNAPIDPTTGLPISTIAAATNEGVSVIKDNGTIVDLVNYVSAPTRVSFVEVGGETKIFTTSRYNNWVNIFDIPHADFDTGPYWPNFAISGLSFGNQFGQTDRDLIIGATNGVVRYAKDPALTGINNISSQWDIPVTAYTTKDYMTGWMVGQTPLATLADIETSILTGGQTVEVRAFDINWTDNGDGSFTSDGTINGNIKFTVNPSVAYRMAFTVDSHTSGNGIHWAQAFFPTTPYVTEPGTYEYVIVPTGNDLWLQSNAWVGTVSNLIVEPAVANRKNTRGLIVNGTITRSPVADGAELVGYSGFSATGDPATSNFLEQPYNSAFDFGTGPFSMIWWENKTVAATRYQLDRRGSTNAGKLTAYSDTSGFLSFLAYDSVGTIIAGGTKVSAIAAPINSWVMQSVVRDENGVLRLFMNGNPAGEFSFSGSITNGPADATLVVGNRWDHMNAWDGMLALLRISATAPTADQITKIYEDERKLFMPGAQCTLYGTSDAVTGLAHDPKTNLLHVGTSAGRSTFDGLQRVANTETPVGAAISAVNGLIAEQ